MSFERMLDSEHQPTEQEILDTIGQVSEWHHLRKYIEENYNFAPEMVFYGKKYGWTIRYRRSGKTLCSLFPEKGSFTVLVILGGKETEKALSLLEEFGPTVCKLLDAAEQLHDGRWLWIRVLSGIETDDIQKLLRVKRKPRKITT